MVCWKRISERERKTLWDSYCVHCLDLLLFLISLSPSQPQSSSSSSASSSSSTGTTTTSPLTTSNLLFRLIATTATCSFCTLKLEMCAIKMTRSDYMLLYNLIMLQIDYKNDYHYLFSLWYYFINHRPMWYVFWRFIQFFYIL